MAPRTNKRPIRVLIVEDSAVMRSLLTKILTTDPEIEVVGTATDPYMARDKLMALTPDVMTLDLELPRMHGIEFLNKVMRHFPTRTVVISAHATDEMSTKARELGAIDVIAKPQLDVTISLEEIGDEIVARVKDAAHTKLGFAIPSREAAPKKSPAVNLASKPTAPPLARPPMAKTTSQHIIAIASSTGGTEALKILLSGFPAEIPGMVIVQHMPPIFTKVYAETLSRILPFEVKEAVEGDRVVPGRALLAPGNFHMELARSGGQYFVTMNQADPLHGVRPAADYLMYSVARIARNRAIGIILTGMGKDGAAGLLAMSEAGSFNLAQDESSCVVFGMPKAAISMGAIHQVASLEKIAEAVIKRLGKTKAAS